MNPPGNSKLEGRNHEMSVLFWAFIFLPCFIRVVFIDQSRCGQGRLLSGHHLELSSKSRTSYATESRKVRLRLRVSGERIVDSTTTIEPSSFQVFASSGFPETRSAAAQECRTTAFHTVHTAAAKWPGHSCLIYMLRDKSHLPTCSTKA